MQTVNLNKLPPQARAELLDFYEFLLKKYMPLEKRISGEKKTRESMFSGQPDIGELAVKLFGSTAGIDLNLPQHPPHKPLDFKL